MKKVLVFLIIGLLFGASHVFGQLVPNVDIIRNNLVDKQVTERTAIMYYNMMENSKKGIMLGHQDAFTHRQINYDDPNMSDIKHTTGQNPLVGGLDFMFITDVQNTPGSWFEGKEKEIKEQALQNYYRGMITAFTWHFRNPYTKDWFSVNGIPERVAISNKSIKSILPGGENHAYYKTLLEKIASVFNELKDSTGTPIPFIFRPFHEFDGNWFWWGKPYCTADEFIETWRFTVHYLRDVLEVRNIIYAFSPDNRFTTTAEYLERYPGDDYVDLVGMDNYYDFESNNINGAALKLKIVSDFAKSRNKLAALTECGFRNASKPNDLYTKKFLTALTKYPLQLSYLMFWANGQYTPIPGQNTAADFIAFVNDTLILAEGDVDDIYSFGATPLKYIKASATETNKKRLDLTLSTDPLGIGEFTGFNVKLDDNAVEIDSSVYSTDDKLLYLYINTTISKNHQITLSYSHGNVVSKEGMKLIEFANQPADNLLTGSAPLLKSAFTDSDGRFIYLVFNKQMSLEGFISDSLKILKSGLIQLFINTDSVSYFNGDMKTIVVETDEMLYAEYKLSASYMHAGFSSLDGGLLTGFINFPIENQSPGLPPKFLSAEVLSNGTGIKLQFDKQLDPKSSAKDGFKVNVNGVEKAISNINYLLNTITLIINGEIVYDDAVALSFIGGNIVSADRGELSTINTFNVVNNLVPIYKARFFNNVTISANSPQFKIDSAYVGNLMYIDRSYLLTDLPDVLTGSEYLIWQNGLKSQYANTLLSVVLLGNGTLYVAHDNRLSKPAWLTNNFKRTDYSFSVPDSRVTLYSGYFSKNQRVELGANQVQGTEIGSSTNYIVFFVPGDSQTQISNIRRQSFKIFPNPCRNEFSVQLDDYTFNKIEIFNMMGKLVYSNEIDLISNNKVFVSLHPSVYIVRLKNNKTAISSLLTVIENGSE